MHFSELSRLHIWRDNLVQNWLASILFQRTSWNISSWSDDAMYLTVAVLKAYITDHKNEHYRFYIGNHYILQFYNHMIIFKKSCVLAPKPMLSLELIVNTWSFYCELRILMWFLSDYIYFNIIRNITVLAKLFKRY